MNPGSAAPCGIFDAIVLGAGASGLAAGLALASSGLRVALIEARNRVGGRIWTHEGMELGAEFIHGLPPEIWRLVHEAGLATRELGGAQLRFTTGVLRRAPDQGGGRVVLDEMTRWMARQAPGADESFADYLRHSPAARDARLRLEAIRYVEGFNAADHRRIGVAALAKQQQADDAIEGDRLFHLCAGYGAVPHHLCAAFEAAGGEVFLERAANRIDWRRGHVVITGVDQTGQRFAFSAAHAVITLPVGVLQAGSVDIEPAPRTALAAIRRMAMGSVVRMPMTFRARFWADDAVTGRMPALAAELRSLSFLFTDCDVETWWTPYPEATAQWVAWVAGPAAADLDRARLREACLATLAAVFDCRSDYLAGQLLSWQFHDWDADRYSMGAYSYMPAGAADASAELSRPIEDTLYFAGEHTTSSGHWGTVHGALQGGYAAADRVLASRAGRPRAAPEV